MKYTSAFNLTLIGAWAAKGQKLRTWFFLTRDTMRKRSLFCRPVSLCPFDTLVNGIHTAEDFVKLFVWSLVFFDPNTDTQFQGGGQNTPGGKFFATFDWNRRLCRKGYEIDRWLLHGTLIGSHGRRMDPCRFRWLWVTPIGFQGQVKYLLGTSQICLRDKVNIEH